MVRLWILLIGFSIQFPSTLAYEEEDHKLPLADRDSFHLLKQASSNIANAELMIISEQILGSLSDLKMKEKESEYFKEKPKNLIPAN